MNNRRRLKERLSKRFCMVDFHTATYLPINRYYGIRFNMKLITYRISDITIPMDDVENNEYYAM